MGNTCKTCAQYRQHYVLDQEKIFRVYCGHCVQSRAKKRRPDTPACEAYVYAPSNENAFASKKYLTKALLQHLLDMELLPDIEDEMREDNHGKME